MGMPPTMMTSRFSSVGQPPAAGRGEGEGRGQGLSGLLPALAFLHPAASRGAAALLGGQTDLLLLPPLQLLLPPPAHHTHSPLPLQRLTRAADAGVVVVPELDGELDDDPEPDGDEAEAADAGHHPLQVGHRVDGAQQRRGAPEKGVEPGRVDNAVALALLDGRAGKGDVARKLLDRQGLACQRGLVDLRQRRAGGRGEG